MGAKKGTSKERGAGKVQGDAAGVDEAKVAAAAGVDAAAEASGGQRPPTAKPRLPSSPEASSGLGPAVDGEETAVSEGTAEGGAEGTDGDAAADVGAKEPPEAGEVQDVVEVDPPPACPACRSLDAPVVDSRHRGDGYVRRQCRRCGHRFKWALQEGRREGA